MGMDDLGALAGQGLDAALGRLMDKLPGWASLFQGSRRWLRIDAADPQLFAGMMVLRFRAEEALSECGTCDIELISADADRELKDFIAAPVTLTLDTDAGKTTLRRMAGLVEKAALLGSDGGVARYRIAVRPALHFLSYAEHNRVFQDRSVQQIVDTILGEHQSALPLLRWQWRLSRSLPVLPYRVQFRETDLAFVQRLLAAAGVFFCVQAGAAAGEHELVFSDDTRSFSGSDSFRFHRAAMSEDEDAIVAWRAMRTQVAGGHTVVSTRREGGGAFQASEYNPLRQGSRGDQLAAALWRHQTRSPGAGPLLDEVVIQNRNGAEHAEADNKLFQGDSTLRQLATGTVFSLRDHPHHDQEAAEDRVFVVLRVEHEGRNEIADRLEWLPGRSDEALSDQPLYCNHFTVIRHRVRWLPAAPASASLPGLQRATVVGSGGEVVHTDALGRIKVCFPWQRAADHRLADTGSALGAEQSSCWLPVAQSSAGPGRGSLWLPRVGDEVLVGFVDDDIDQPVVMGSLFHPGHQPSSFKAVSALPADKSLTGIRSVEHHGTRASELIFDDTTNEPHVTLRSDHGDSHAQFGVLTSERSGGNASLRGEGFDLFTGRWASVRSGWGLFLNAQSGASSGDHHFRRQTLTAQLDTLQTVVSAHKDGAKQLRTTAVPDKDFATLKGHVSAWQQGDKPQNTQPIIVAHGDAGTVLSSSENTLVSARTQIDLNSTQAIGIQAGTTWTASASDQIAFWSWKAGVALNAGGKDLILRANSKQIIGEAEKGIRLSGIDGNVHLESGKEIVLTAQGSYIKIGKNIEIGTKGKIHYKAAQHLVQGGSKLNGSLPGLSQGSGDTNQKFYVRTPDGYPLNDMLHNVKVNGAIRKARLPTGKSGETSLEPDSGFSTMRVELLALPKARVSGNEKIRFDEAGQDIKEKWVEVPLRFYPDGMPYADASLTPKAHDTRQLFFAPPPTVIPVIFVPGIMGSNIETSEDSSAAWVPPNGAVDGIREWGNRKGQTPAERQRQLNPAMTRVSNSGTIALSEAMKSLLDEDEARRRGWGEVYAESYGEILLYLEEHLNRRVADPATPKAKLKPDWERALDGILSSWGDGIATLTADELKPLSDYYFPVFACGYNWLQSNEQSALTLAKRVDEALARFNNGYFKTLNGLAGKVILITHSMGGLVARRYAKDNPDKVLGVIHGVQPVGGAPVVYRRFRAGTESKGWWDIAGNMFATIAGKTAAEVTAVMANAPGPLELLPTADYNGGQPWLHVEQRLRRWFKADRNTELLALPRGGDPYNEIYKVRVSDQWWGMLDEALLDPAGQYANRPPGAAFESYINRISAVQAFHESIQRYFHPATWSHYGDFNDQECFPDVRWISKEDWPHGVDNAQVLAARRAAFVRAEAAGASAMDASSSAAPLADLDDALTGTAELLVTRADGGHELVVFELGDKEGAVEGDGTVPSRSGQMVDGLAVFRMQKDKLSNKKSFDHQNSYKHTDIKRLVLWSMVRAAQKAGGG